jgi:hypothetical protein
MRCEWNEQKVEMTIDYCQSDLVTTEKRKSIFAKFQMVKISKKIDSRWGIKWNQIILTRIMISAEIITAKIIPQNPLWYWNLIRTIWYIYFNADLTNLELCKFVCYWLKPNEVRTWNLNQSQFTPSQIYKKKISLARCLFHTQSTPMMLPCQPFEHRWKKK